MAGDTIQSQSQSDPNLNIGVTGTQAPVGPEQVEKAPPMGGLGTRARYQDVMDGGTTGDTSAPLPKAFDARYPTLLPPLPESTFHELGTASKTAAPQMHEGEVSPLADHTTSQDPTKAKVAGLQQLTNALENLPDIEELLPEALGITTLQDYLPQDAVTGKTKEVKAKGKDEAKDDAGDDSQQPEADADQPGQDATTYTTKTLTLDRHTDQKGSGTGALGSGAGGQGGQGVQSPGTSFTPNTTLGTTGGGLVGAGTGGVGGGIGGVGGSFGGGGASTIGNDAVAGQLPDLDDDEDVEVDQPLTPDQAAARAAAIAAGAQQVEGATNVGGGLGVGGIAMPGLGSIVPSINSQAAQMLRGAAQYFQDVQSIVEKYSSQMKGPAAVSIFDAMKEISQALSEAENMIRLITSQNAQGTRDVTSAQWEEQNAQIQIHKQALDQQSDQQKEIDKNKAKSDKTNLAMKILTPIMIAIAVVATVASFGTMGPLAIALTVALLAVQVAQQVTTMAGGPNWMQTAMQKIGEGIGYALRYASPYGYIMRAAGMSEADTMKWLSMVGEVVAIVAIVLAARDPAGGTRAISLALSQTAQMLSYDNPVVNMLIQCGVDKNTAAYVGVALVGALTIASAGIGMYKVAAQKAELVAQMRQMLVDSEKDLATVTANNLVSPTATDLVKQATIPMRIAVLKMSLKIMEDLQASMQLGQTAVQLGINASQLSNDFFSYYISQAQAALAKIKASEEMGSIQFDDILDAIKMVIKRLQDALNALMHGTVTIDRLQIKKYDVAKVEFTPPSTAQSV